jgi:hypothetical protein
MKPVRTEDLIVALAADASRVVRLPSVTMRASRWMAAAATLTMLGVSLIGFRADLLMRIREVAFAREAALILAAGVLAAIAAFVLSVPGAERTGYQRLLPLPAVLAWVGALAERLAREGAPWAAVMTEPWHLACGAQILVLSLAPALAAFVMIRRAAPLQFGWTAFLSALAALAFATAGVQLACPIDPASHVLVSHALPLAVLTVLGAAAGARWLGGFGLRATVYGEAREHGKPPETADRSP